MLGCNIYREGLGTTVRLLADLKSTKREPCVHKSESRFCCDTLAIGF